MGLKVLLADDSSAIKKVVQLCLQDFGVELKSTGNGKDVLDLMRQFSPDLALIDVMLPHKPGYDVVKEIKSDPQLKNTPVIVLWSSFMDFDDAKFATCGAEGRLEKPFEAKDLRDIVKKYVPKTSNNPFMDLVEVPSAVTTASTLSTIQKPPAEKLEVTHSTKQPPIQPTLSPEGQANEIPTPPTAGNKTEAEAWSMSSFMDIGKFSESLEKAAEGESDWVRKDLGKFNIQVTEDEIAFKAPTEDLGQNPVPPLKSSSEASVANSPSPILQPTAEEIRRAVEIQIQKIIEKEARGILEKAIWKIVPDMATDLIREEIKRLTDAE